MVYVLLIKNKNGINIFPRKYIVLCISSRNFSSSAFLIVNVAVVALLDRISNLF